MTLHFYKVPVTGVFLSPGDGLLINALNWAGHEERPRSVPKVCCSKLESLAMLEERGGGGQINLRNTSGHIPVTKHINQSKALRNPLNSLSPGNSQTSDHGHWKHSGTS